MILHIFNKQEKFSIPFVCFLKDYHVDLENHMFFHYGKSSGYFEKEGVNALFSGLASVKKHWKLYREMKKADKILIHGLASPFLLLLLMLRCDVSRKFYWLIWGKDLYFTQCVNMRNPIMKLYELARKKAIRNIKHIVTNIDGDYELARKWYHTEAELLYLGGLAYPYNSSEIEELQIAEKQALKYILLGHSASISNNHLEALDYMKKQDDGSIEIICPLSYGGPKRYVEQVMKKGRELFGERFQPLVDFMPLEEYNNILKRVDVAFFFHRRQEAFNNTITLLGTGKKVYIRTESTLWDYFQKQGIIVHDSCGEADALQQPEAIEVLKNNYEQVKRMEDIQVSLNGWKRLFRENRE